MFTTIMIGIGGQDGDRDAIALARALAPEAAVTLADAYPFDDVPSRFGLRAYGAIMRADAVEMLERARDAAGLTQARLEVIGDSSPARGLHRLAERDAADLLVIGSSHRGMVGRLLLGDVARTILHDSPCPVAVAPRGFAGEVPRRIGVPFDGSAESREALRVGAALAAEHGAALRAVTAVELNWVAMAGSFPTVEVSESVRAEAWRQLDAALHGLPVPCRGEALLGSPHDVLERFAREVDLLVCGSRAWGAVRRVTLGSTAEWLVHAAPCPVLVVPRTALPEPAAVTPVPAVAGA